MADAIMSNILQRYGIKEVADVTFYDINNDGTIGKPVLVLDSLKVTSIEQTAESAEARGGKGNAKLIVWDFGKEITVNIEDALFSPKSLAIMMADGRVTEDAETTKVVKRSARVVATKTDSDSVNYSATAPQIFIDGREINATEIQGGIKWYHAKAGEVGLEEMPSSSPQ